MRLIINMNFYVSGMHARHLFLHPSVKWIFDESEFVIEFDGWQFNEATYEKIVLLSKIKLFF